MKTEQNLSKKVKALIRLAGYWQKTMPGKPAAAANPSRRQWDGLLKLLDGFSDFADDYEKVMKKTPMVNQRFIVNRSSEHLLQTFSILCRASEQRRGRVMADSMHGFLSMAEDKLETYCQRWLPDAITEKSSYTILGTPVVYFEKLYGITRAIFAPEVPIISIPLTEYSDPDRWQALAHEMGHHIYWNSLKDLESVEDLHTRMEEKISDAIQRTDGSMSPWESWMEEIFADVCGTLLDGVDYFFSCQEYVIERVKVVDDLANNDGEHPCSHLRPLFASQVLREIAASINDLHLQNAVEKLEQRWRTFSCVADGLICKGTNRTLESLAAEVQPVVRAILHARIWPGNQTLWNLIQFYGKNGLDAAEEEKLQNLQLDQPVLLYQGVSSGQTTSPNRPFVPTLIPSPKDEDIPERLQTVWSFLKERVDAAHTESDPNEKAWARWNALLDLELDESHGHATAHQRCRRHLLYPSLHKHNAGDTGSAIPCS